MLQKNGFEATITEVIPRSHLSISGSQATIKWAHLPISCLVHLVVEKDAMGAIRCDSHILVGRIDKLRK